MDGIAIHVRDLEKRYRVWTHTPPTNLKERLAVASASFGARLHLAPRTHFRQEVHALRGVSFDVRRGEVLGVIGPNGAGKSTLLSILARITEPSAGYAELRGRTSSLLEVGTGFHPELSGRDNVFLNGAILGMSRMETARKFDEIVDFSGVAEFIDIPVKRYSSGMQVRLAFAVAAHLDPEILLLDEVLAVGDAQFQARCHAHVREMTSGGRTVLFVSHDVTSVARLCDRAILLDHGRIAFEGPAAEAVDTYLAGARAGSPDRRGGSGTCRVRRVGVVAGDGYGAPRSGESVLFTVELDGQPSVASKITLSVKTPDGAVLVKLASEVNSREAECLVDGLPLNPATYVVGASVEQLGKLVDDATAITEFTLRPSSESDAPGVRGAPVLVSQSWSSPEASSVSPTVRSS